MAKKLKGPQIVIANKLDDGRVVFMKADGNWSYKSEEALVADNDTAYEKALVLAAKAEQSNDVISALLVEAELTDAGPVPVHPKFGMQKAGPSVRLDLGYQAEGAAA